jgi:hypothetical protein
MSSSLNAKARRNKEKTKRFLRTKMPKTTWFFLGRRREFTTRWERSLTKENITGHPEMTKK